MSDRRGARESKQTHTPFKRLTIPDVARDTASIPSLGDRQVGIASLCGAPTYALSPTGAPSHRLLGKLKPVRSHWFTVTLTTFRQNSASRALHASVRSQVEASKPAASLQTEVPAPQIALRKSNQYSLENPNNKAGNVFEKVEHIVCDF